MDMELTFLSPAFLYGADKTRPEFRIPSLIGQMRYWWRMTQYWSAGNFEQLKSNEGEIFGIADETGSKAKPFSLYLAQKPEIKASPTPNQTMKKGQPVQGKYDFPTKGRGVQYFFYPFMRHDGLFKWIPEGSKVRLKMKFKPGADRRQPILLSLFLLSRFGGLGGRSRRGAGAIELAGDDLFKLTEKDLIDYVRSEQRDTLPGHEAFRLIHPSSPLWLALQNARRVKKSHPPQAGWDAALNAVGSAMQNFRTTQKICLGNKGKVDPDFIQEAIDLHRHYADPSHHSPPDPNTKDAFGLPRIINFTSCQPPARNALTITPYKQNGPDSFEESRRASPLHITVNRSGGKYYCTLLVLWDGLKFLPPGTDIRVKHKHNSNVSKYPVIQHPPVDKLEAFLNLTPMTTI